jgi:hypothetical protein
VNARERPTAQPAVDLGAAYRAVDGVEERLLADAGYRVRFIPRGRRSDEERRRSLGLDARTQPTPGQPQSETLAERLDKMSVEQRDNLREQLDAAEERALWAQMTPEEQAVDTEAAIQDADLEFYEQAGAGMMDEPDGYDEIAP